MHMRHIDSWTLIVFGALGALGGCGGSDAIPIEDLPASLEQALCRRAVACAGAADQASCEATNFLAENAGVLTIVQSVKRGGVTYDGAKASACLRELEADCADLPTDSSTCDAVFTGTVAAGGACVTSVECLDDGRCVPPGTCTDACCVGTCRGKPIPLPVGASCTTADATCVDGAFCANGGTCLPELPVGSACTGTGCASPAVCLRNPDDGSEICTVISTVVGAPCLPGANFGCGRSDEHCNATTRTCTKRAQPGAPCQEDADCVGYASCVAGICKTRPTLGQPCDGSTGIYCQGGLICPAGVCAAPVTATACVITD